MSWFFKAFKRYAVFSGRAQRKEYWYFYLYYFVFFCAFMVIDFVTGYYHAQAGVGLLSGILFLILLIPGLAVGNRRLHDTNRSGFWQFLWLVPILGTAILIFFLSSDSHPEDNKYGSNLKEQ